MSVWLSAGACIKFKSHRLYVRYRHHLYLLILEQTSLTINPVGLCHLAEVMLAAPSAEASVYKLVVVYREGARPNVHDGVLQVGRASHSRTSSSTVQLIISYDVTRDHGRTRPPTARTRLCPHDDDMQAKRNEDRKDATTPRITIARGTTGKLAGLMHLPMDIFYEVRRLALYLRRFAATA